MPPRLRGFAFWAAGQVPTFVTLAALIGLAIWGAENDWKIPHLWRPATKEMKEAADAAIQITDVHDPAAGDAGSRSIASMQIEFPTADAVRRAGIQVAAVQIRTLVKQVTAYGSIDYEPSLYARVTAKAAGTVWRMRKEVGDKVQKGELLALVDSAEVGKVKADFLHSLAQVRLRTATLKQLQLLGGGGVISERSWRDAENELREARIRLFSDQQALLNLGFPLRLKDVEDLSEEQLARKMRVLGLPPSVLTENDPETLTANLLPVVAPFDGQIVQRYAALGELQQLTQPKPMYVVADISRLHFELDVSPEDIGELRLGQDVAFRPEGAKTDAASGKISHISPEVDEKTRRIRAHAEFENQASRLRPNTFGTARIVVRECPNATVVPTEAVQYDVDSNLVFVRVAETRFRPRLVQPGIRDGNWLEVTNVRPGEEVATLGSFLLKSEIRKEKIAGGDD
jgi:cobalt-zinc-cadmium efflux system membrane fusion protein